jgi:hypothetical protein
MLMIMPPVDYNYNSFAIGMMNSRSRISETFVAAIGIPVVRLLFFQIIFL